MSLRIITEEYQIDGSFLHSPELEGLGCLLIAKDEDFIRRERITQDEFFPFTKTQPHCTGTFNFVSKSQLKINDLMSTIFQLTVRSSLGIFTMNNCFMVQCTFQVPGFDGNGKRIQMGYGDAEFIAESMSIEKNFKIPQTEDEAFDKLNLPMLDPPKEVDDPFACLDRKKT